LIANGYAYGGTTRATVTYHYDVGSDHLVEKGPDLPTGAVNRRTAGMFGWIVSYFVGTTIALCFVPFTKNKNKTFQTAAHLWARFLIFFSGQKITVMGLENIPKNQPLILVANHQGVMDIPLLLAFLPVRFRFAIKKNFSIYRFSAGI
jgi:hypothetical protein